MGSEMSVCPTPDEVLLESAKAGDSGSLAMLFERHRGRLERIARLRLDRRLQRRVDAADVVRETYLAARKNFAAQFVPSNMSFFVWLRTELGEKLTDAHRLHLGSELRDTGTEISLHQGASPQVTSVSLAEQLLGRLTNPSHAAMRVELKMRVQEAINSLDPQDRDMLALRHFEELSNSEAAEVLGIRASAACTRYVRALKRLKDVIGELPDQRLGKK